MDGVILFVIGFTLTLAIISIADVMIARTCFAK